VRPASQQLQPPVTTFDTATPGAAPSAVAAIPQSSTGTSAPTQPSHDAVVPTLDTTTHLVALTQGESHQKSLVQQVLEVLEESRVESHKVHKYLPDFFKKLGEGLSDELRGHRGQTPQTPTTGESESNATTVSGAVFAYQAVSLTSMEPSIRT
jgi:hypothetical protein